MIIINRKDREATNVRDDQYILNTSSKFQIRFNELVTKEGKRPIYASKTFQQEPHIEMLKGREKKNRHFANIHTYSHNVSLWKTEYS